MACLHPQNRVLFSPERWEFEGKWRQEAEWLLGACLAASGHLPHHSASSESLGLTGSSLEWLRIPEVRPTAAVAWASFGQLVVWGSGACCVVTVLEYMCAGAIWECGCWGGGCVFHACILCIWNVELLQACSVACVSDTISWWEIKPQMVGLATA